MQTTRLGAGLLEGARLEGQPGAPQPTGCVYPAPSACQVLGTRKKPGRHGAGPQETHVQEGQRPRRRAACRCQAGGGDAEEGVRGAGWVARVWRGAFQAGIWTRADAAGVRASGAQTRQVGTACGRWGGWGALGGGGPAGPSPGSSGSLVVLRGQRTGCQAGPAHRLQRAWRPPGG